MPNDSMFEKRAGKMIGEFKDLVFPEGYVPGAKKRPAAGGAGGAPKKPKPDAGDIDIEAEARANKLSKYTIPVLKEFVKKLKIQPDGNRKADIIDAIMDHYEI